jgi:uncharacterized protein YyaL (SSP411 family)
MSTRAKDHSTGRPNRLVHELSPYLLQHAYNPVDWYPWGDEAFAAAAREEKPIFLSIGYSTCHWCHVMERESFESEAIAKMLEDSFISIKVDREEHPDIDQIYMAVVQRTTGHGGWPMSVFLTPDRKPFFAGTYFPPTSRWGQPGFADLLMRIREAWKTQRAALSAHGDEIIATLLPATKKSGGTALDRRPIENCVRQLERSYDPTWGGFGDAPKFPRSMTLMLLLRDRLASGDDGDQKRAMVEKTLEMMWRGGLYDHVGGAFARYSTDARWLVPHFEKMLYDNALLVLAYTEAWQAKKNPDHALVVSQTLHWVVSEMTHADGGFYSAIDADSEGEEGKFYLWSPKELADVLGADDAALAERIFGVDERGNFEGKSILFLPKPLEATATLCGLDRAALLEKIGVIRCKLYGARQKRVPPGLDDKVLSSWNGLMIAAFARAGAAFCNPKWVAAAERAAEFSRAKLEKDGVLLRRFRADDARHSGTLEDYAFMAWGELEIFSATGSVDHLERARRLVETAIVKFRDAESGGFFFTEKDAPNVLVRMKEPYDGATPSGNSVMAWNLLLLEAWTGEDRYRVLAEETFAAFADDLARYAMAYPMLLLALDRARGKTGEIVVVDGKNVDEADRMESKIRASFRPYDIVLRVTTKNRDALIAALPWLAAQIPVDGRSTAYVCSQRTCSLPIKSAEQLAL